MRKRISRLSMLTKTVIVLALTILVAAVVVFSLMSRAVTQVVTSQVNEGTQNTVDVSASQLNSLTALGTSVLVSLRLDETLQSRLEYEPSTAYERQQLFSSISDILNSAYFALNDSVGIAIVSQYGDAYANWTNFNTDMLLTLKADYEARREAGEVASSSMAVLLEEGVSLSEAKGEGETCYVQFMPLLGSDNRTLIGVGMVLIPSSALYSLAEFPQGENHTTYVTDRAGQIVGSADPSLLGKSLSEVTGGELSGLSVTSSVGYRDLLKVVDILSPSYIRRQTLTILAPMGSLTLLAMAVILVVCTFLMRSIIHPLAALTEKMVNRDYRSFTEDNAADLGHNEIAVLERGFEVMGQDIRDLITRSVEEEQKKREIEIAALQAQIQPHFLFTTLNSVRCSIRSRHDDKAADMILDLIMLLRMTLMKGDEMITLRQELDTIGHYLNILRMRHTTPFTYEEEIDPETEELPVPKLLLQPVVENCIVHGFGKGDREGTINVVTERQGETWYIWVSNDGLPLEHDIDLTGEKVSGTGESFSGIGIRNVNNRLKLYYGEDCGLRIYTEDGWTVADRKLTFRRRKDGKGGEKDDTDAGG